MSASPAPTSPARVRGVFVAALLAWFGAFALAPFAFFALGVNHYGPWFLDLYAILASNDAVTAGLDPYAPNPLDPFHRPHVYAAAWLHLRDLGLTRLHTLPLGLALVGAFIVAALGTLRPGTWREALGFFLVCGAPPVLLAIDRANNDLVVFLLLLPVVPCLLDARRAVRLLALFCVAAATSLKFYPVVAAPVLLLVGDSKEMRQRALLLALILGFVGLGVARDIAAVAPGLPRAEGLTTFGAINLLEAVGLHGRLAWVAIALGVALTTVLAWRAPWLDAPAAAEDRGDGLRFALGALLLTGCFFAGTNYAYRWVFALWMAPLLWRLPRDENAPLRLRQLARLTRGLLLLALWADPLASALLTRLAPKLTADAITRLADRFFLLEQPATWALFLCLLVFCVRFVRDAVRRLLGRAA